VIVRVLTARVRPGKVGQFNVAMRRQLEIMRDQPGLVFVKLARRLERGGGEEAILFEEWRDPDSVYAWAGEDLSRPRLLPAAHDAAEVVYVTHYESLDVGLDEPLGGEGTEGAGLTASPSAGSSSGEPRSPDGGSSGSGSGDLPGGGHGAAARP
jgi:heme-degrading monooxygenase HmoA